MSISTTAAADLFRHAPDRFLDVGGGGEVAYRRVGVGPDVLFVHGWPVSSATFRTPPTRRSRSPTTSGASAARSICSAWTTSQWSATTVAG
jgi:pimeloyl-ACP methyl ester carboxylesterase